MEGAMSNYDINAFSLKDKANNKGFAGKVNVNRLIGFETKNGKQLFAKAAAGYEQTNKNFRPLERLRTVEFYRDWGLELQPELLQNIYHLPALKLVTL
jgi:hypothetical protein